MAEIAAGRLAAAARALTLAGRWAQATELLDDAVPASEAERAVLAVAAAEVAVEQDFWIRTDCGSSALARAARTGAAASGGTVAYDLEFAGLRHDYDVQLFGAGDGEPSWGPEGRDPAVLEALAARAAALRDDAPDMARRARTAFYAGLIADNLRGDTVTGRASYEEALRAGEEAGDDLIVSYAVRHLGYLACQAGDVPAGRELLRRSLELRQRAGCVPHVLAQLLALADLDHDAGHVAGARAAAGVVHGWASALNGKLWLVAAAESMLSATP